MVVIWAIYWWLVGAVADSAAITLADRLHARLPLWTRSHCFICKHHLGALDLIPVFSYLWLRGRCRYCKAPIPLWIFLVELAGDAVALGIYLAITL
jgi:leader peptidase (prepilin peptidase)/N-methyltransferase